MFASLECNDAVTTKTGTTNRLDNDILKRILLYKTIKSIPTLIHVVGVVRDDKRSKISKKQCCEDEENFT